MRLHAVSNVGVEARRRSKENVRLLQISSQNTGVEEDKERFLALVLGDETPETRAANVVPDLKPGVDLGRPAFRRVGRRSSARKGIIVVGRRVELVVAVVVGVVVVDTGPQAGDGAGRIPITIERSRHGLAEESLTFFPDSQCCPPSGTVVATAGVTGAGPLLGRDGQPVVGGECGEGGT